MYTDDMLQRVPTSSKNEAETYSASAFSSAQYYNSALSIWLSVDPMVDKYPNLSPYTYCANNPVRLVDPEGREIGNYYNISGTYLGTDGKQDGEVYIVTRIDEIKKIKDNDNIKGGTTQLSEVPSAMRLPFIETRKKFYNQVKEGDEANNFAEHGGIYGIDLHSNIECARPAKEGPTCDPVKSNDIASIDYNTVNTDWLKKIGTYHSHPSGENEGSHFIQKPSEIDYNNAFTNATKFNMTGTNMFFGMADGKVYLYDSRNNKATISISTFLNIR